jgi:hypothetical protein
VWSESEPNDTAWLAPWFGSLFAGESIFVGGFSTDDGSDPQDGLAFTGYGPCRIDFTLYVDDPWADLDVWVYDPELDQFVYAFTSPYGDESGTFWIQSAADFQLVIVPSSGASTWTLGVWASGPVYGSAVSDSMPALPVTLEEYAHRDRAEAALPEPDGAPARAEADIAPR